MGGSSLRFSRVAPGWPTTVHGFGVRERHDETLRRVEVLEGRFARGSCGRGFVLPGEVWTAFAAISALLDWQLGGIQCQVRVHEFLAPGVRK